MQIITVVSVQIIFYFSFFQFFFFFLSPKLIYSPKS